MSQDDDVERVARALAHEASTTEMRSAGFNARHRNEYVEICWRDHEDRARAALSAMPQRLSPELIAQLNKLATYLTAQGEYEACDLIDTVVARVSAMPPRELLAEALEALQGLHDDVVEYVTLNKLHDADGSPAINNHWMRRARAAADKIRAALTQEKQT